MTVGVQVDRSGAAVLAALREVSPAEADTFGAERDLVRRFRTGEDVGWSSPQEYRAAKGQ